MVNWKWSNCLICSFPADVQLWSVTKIFNFAHLHNGTVAHSPCLQVLLLGFSFQKYSCCVCLWYRVRVFKLWENQAVSQTLAPSPSKKAYLILGNPWCSFNQRLSQRLLPSSQKFKCCFLLALQKIFWHLLILALFFKIGVLHCGSCFGKKPSHVL